MKRTEAIARLQSESFDLLIVGGGITGAGIALDAASRGLKTALIEKGDFASGTSSRSTKLVHGGLRYLQNLEFKLVREVGKERSLIHYLAPHLAIPEKMLLPLTKGGKYGRLDSRFGLWFYDLLAAVPRQYRRKMLNKKKALKQEPILPQHDLLGAGLYTEFRTDDARLTIEVIKTAERYGAVCINYCELDEFVHKAGQIAGAKCTDHISHFSIEISSEIVVNATGPWVDLIRRKTEEIKGKRLHLTKGIHIVVPHAAMPVKQSVYFDIPDGRMVFAIPRLDKTYIGTTDTDYFDSPDQVSVLKEDQEYLITAVNNVFPAIRLSENDIVSSWAGLRPLIHEPGKSASEISRKDEIFISDSGLISIAGGKLTGYRVMAKKTVNQVVKKLSASQKGKIKACQTRKIPLTQNSFNSYDEVLKLIQSIAEALPDTLANKTLKAKYLVHNYGLDAQLIINRFISHNGATEFDLLMEELSHCIKSEQCITAEDFFDRRTGLIYFNPQLVKYSEKQVSEKLKRLFVKK